MKAEAKWFIINGAPRLAVYNPDVDSIVDVVRRMGLTGTKIGCGTGQCGACSMIIDGELVRGCVRKAAKVRERAEILTIEGIGTPTNLHPIQQAWITYGGVQCGFCSPGFIVSAYALLQKNQNPTRQEVRDWFTRHRNLCRCTGYKQLIDAVMAAAAVMRGEKTMADITYHYQDGERIFGTRYPKPTAMEKVTGLCNFGDDIGLAMPEGTLHLAAVMPEANHAFIKKIDTEKAKACPGVVAVYTAEDMIGNNICDAGGKNTGYFSKLYAENGGHMRQVLASDKIRRNGDAVAVVVAYTNQIARAAAKLVDVELEELPAYHDITESFQPGAIKVAGNGEEGPENVYDGCRVCKGEDTRAIFEKAPYVAEGSFYSQREPHLPIEPDVMQAYLDSDGRLVIHNKSQCTYKHRDYVSWSLGLPKDKVVIIENPTGGSFGYSMSPTPLALVSACAIKLNTPVSYTCTYAEHQLWSGKRSASFHNARMACDENGRLIAMEADMVIDCGSYNEKGDGLIRKVQSFFGYPYSIPNIKAIATCGFSNNAHAIAYRGFGMPQIYTMSEALMDMLAEKIGMDPFEFRYKNLLREGDTICTNATMDEYPMAEMFDRLRPYYEESKKWAAEDSGDPDIKRGVGVSCGGYSSAGGTDKCDDELELNPDGSITVWNTYAQVGQGSDIGTLTAAHEFLRPLGIRPDQIHLVQNNTAQCPDSSTASGSRAFYVNGLAIKKAAELLIDAMRKDDGSYRTYDEMVAEGIPTKYLGHLQINPNEFNIIKCDPIIGVGRNYPEFNYSAYVARVEVNTKTGKVKVVALRAAASFGNPGNLNAVDGQAYGGFEHSLGMALSEDYDSFQPKKYSTMAGCGFPTCNDVPDDMEFEYVPTYRKCGPGGASGTSENLQSNGHMSIINAINNAVGVRVYEMPATPAKILAGLNGQDLMPKKYDFGHDFEELYDRITALAEEKKRKMAEQSQ